MESALIARVIRRRSAAGWTSRWIVVGAAAATAIAAGGLSVLALHHVSPRAPDSEVAPLPTFDPAPEAVPTPAPSLLVPVSDRADERYITVGDGVLWRGVAGACGAAEPLLERSTDGGASWNDVTPRYLQIGQLASLDAFGGSEAQIIASSGESCEQMALRTFTQGEFWEPSDQVLAEASFVDPVDLTRVVVFGQTTVAPCADPRALRTQDDAAIIICGGTAQSYARGGEWSPLPATGVTAAAFTDDGVLVAHVADGCPGVAFSHFSRDGSSAGVGCATDADASQPTAIATDRDHVLLWSGASWVAVPL